MIILGRKLQRLREELGLSLRQAAAMTRGSLSPSKLSAIETAKRPVTVFDVAGLCHVYEASSVLRQQLQRMGEEALSPGWWEPYLTYVLEDFAMFLELEEICKAIDIYDSELITGLLQTEEYARRVHAVSPILNEGSLQQAVTLRDLRKERFWGRNPLPIVRVVMHEFALTRPICGEKGDAAQRAHLLGMARSGKADIRVIPMSSGAHPSATGAYTILSSGLPELDDVVYTETIAGARYESDPATVEHCRTFFEATLKLAIPVEEFLT